MTVSCVFTTIELGEYQLAYEGDATPLFTENETNSARLHGYPNGQPFVKDAFHEYVVHGRTDAVNPGANRDKVRTALRLGDRTRAIAGREAAALSETAKCQAMPLADFDQIFAERMKEADEFYDAISPAGHR